MSAEAATSETDLVMWTVYDHPRDFPHSFVARKLVVGRDGAIDTSQVIVCRQVVLIREWMQRRGFWCMPRQAADDPVILEVWL